MDNSNTPAANPAPSADKSANAAPAAQPVAPASNSVVPGGKPGSSKGLIIGLCVGGFLIILITVLCIIFIPMLFGIDWEATHTAAENFDTAARKIESECGNVTSYMTSTYTSDSEYDGYVKKCKNSINSYIEAVDALKDASGVKKNKEIKAKYEEFMTSYEKIKPVYESLPDTLKAFHKLYSTIYDMDSDEITEMTDENIDELFSDLLKSDNENVKEVAEKFSGEIKSYLKTYKTYLEAREAWYDISYSDPNYDSVYQAYTDARDAYYDADIDSDFDMEDMFGITDDEVEEFHDREEALYSTMSNLYYQNH